MHFTGTKSSPYILFLLKHKHRFTLLYLNFVGSPYFTNFSKLCVLLKVVLSIRIWNISVSEHILRINIPCLISARDNAYTASYKNIGL